MGVSMAATVCSTQYVYGDNALSAVQIRHWFKEFQNGRDTIVDRHRRSKEKTGRSQENIDKVKAALD